MTIWDEASDAFDLAIGYSGGETDSSQDYPSGCIVWEEQRATVQRALSRGRKLEEALRELMDRARAVLEEGR
jgi:hypothetical protein